MAAIFLSYRREDSGSYCDRLMDYLSTSFGSPKIFRDIQTIPSGSNYLVILKSALQACRVQLVLIGPLWLTIADVHGVPRLKQQGDLVRFEIARALQTGKVVIIVLIGGAQRPTAPELPPELAPLASCQYVTLRDDPWFIQDMKMLNDLIARALRWRPASISIGILGLVSTACFSLILLKLTTPYLALFFQYSWLIPLPGLLLSLYRSFQTSSWIWFIPLCLLLGIYLVTSVPLWFLSDSFIGIFLFDLVATNVALVIFGALGPHRPNAHILRKARGDR